jgi:hypothetical protein
MEHKKWIKENVDTFNFDPDILSITCGHGRQDNIIVLRQENPRVVYVCCPGCCHMILGEMIERAFTLTK